jgi:hypothetical protein
MCMPDPQGESYDSFYIYIYNNIQLSSFSKARTLFHTFQAPKARVVSFKLFLLAGLAIDVFCMTGPETFWLRC